MRNAPQQKDLPDPIEVGCRDASSLQYKTLVYWHISQSWNNSPNAIQYSAGDAITDLMHIRDYTNPERKLMYKCHDLQEAIVYYGTKRSKTRDDKKNGAVREPAQVIIVE